ncbi:MAG: DUF362 domain-containing protein [Chitinispirillaceae bacterium]|nr:DUF362 domain-containing protein [Chitinispirillaceae bacterium]
MAINRRSFLQKSVAGAAAITAGGVKFSNVFSAPAAWTDGMQINPAIDNKKVVCCYDTGMLNSDIEDVSTFRLQNNAVITSKVESNMDVMAKTLADKSDAAAAWATIFRKPDSKEWGEVKVAIKVNCIYTMIMPRIAIVGKVCQELIRLGVASANITVYDACSGATGNGKYTPYIGNGLPTGVVVSNGTQKVSVTVGSGQQSCTTVVTQCDILVNCAVNKGHGQGRGGFTLTMKNHTGTMKFSCPSNLTEMIDQNKSDAILGGSPVRQQLCIVDSLWAAVQGPGSAPTHTPCRIVMGTFGPMVDIAVARQIRENIMNAPHNTTAITSILSGFGYSESDINWSEFTQDPVREKNRLNSRYADRPFRILMENGNIRSTMAQFTLPVDARMVKVSVIDLKGKLVRELIVDARGMDYLLWDGLTRHGTPVRSGSYTVRFYAAGGVQRGTIIVAGQ